MGPAGPALLPGVPPRRGAALPAEQALLVLQGGQCPVRDQQHLLGLQAGQHLLGLQGGLHPPGLQGQLQPLGLQGGQPPGLQGGQQRWLRGKLQGVHQAWLTRPHQTGRGLQQQRVQLQAAQPARQQQPCQLQSRWQAGWLAGWWDRLLHHPLDVWQCCYWRSLCNQSWQLLARPRACQRWAVEAPPPLGGRSRAGQGPA